MPKLSEILAADTGEERFFGVEVDVESVSPPHGLREIAFTLKTSDGDIDESLLDAVISYTLSGVEVVLEVPGSFAEEITREGSTLSAGYLMQVAANAGFTLSLLPPEDTQSEDSRESYFSLVEAFVPVYFSQANFSKMVYPVTNYLQYMFTEIVTGEDLKSFKPTDEYVSERFAHFPVKFSDAMKDRIRAAVYARFGGQQEFVNFARALLYKLYEQAEENCQQAQAQYASSRDGGSGEAGSTRAAQ